MSLPSCCLVRGRDSIDCMQQGACMPGRWQQPSSRLCSWHGRRLRNGSFSGFAGAAWWLLLLLAVTAVTAQQQQQQEQELQAGLRAAQHQQQQPPKQQTGLTAFVMPWLSADVQANHSYAHLRAILAPPVLQRYAVIALAADYKVKPWLWSDASDLEPVRLTRNLTITSANYSTAGYRLLELEFLSNRLLIPRGVTLTLEKLALGRARKTVGNAIPFFAGEGETSTLLFSNVVRVRTACAHNTPELLAALQRIERPASAATRSNDSTPPLQRVSILPAFPFRGTVYPGSVHAEDLHAFISPADVADTSFYAGYALVQLNTTRVCESYVSDECVAKRGGDVCVLQQVNAVLQAEEQQPPCSLNLPAVVAPAVVGGVALLAAGAVAALLLKRRRSRQAAAQQALLPVSKRDKLPRLRSGRGPPVGGAGGSVCGGPPDNDEDEGGPVFNATALPGAHSGTAGSIESLAVGSRGGRWSLVSWHRAAEFEDATPDDKLRLGVLLGAGSFGRVYRGVWRHLDVAVKVMQHDASTAAAISNEVDLVMSFRHPNVVSAYFFLTWSRCGEAVPPSWSRSGNDEHEQVPPAAPPTPAAAVPAAVEVAAEASGPLVIPSGVTPTSTHPQHQQPQRGLVPVGEAGGAGGGMQAYSIIDSAAVAPAGSVDGKGGCDGKRSARGTLSGSNSTTGRSLASSSGMAARTASAAATAVIAGGSSCDSSACHAPLQQRSLSPELPGDQQQQPGQQQLVGGPGEPWPAGEPYPAALSILQLAALHRAAAGGVDAAQPPDQAAAAADVGGGGAPSGSRSHHRVSFKGGTSVASSAAGTSSASLIPAGFCQQQQSSSSTDLALQLSSQQLPVKTAVPAAPAAATARRVPILPDPLLHASAMAFCSSANSSCCSSSQGTHRRQAPGLVTSGEAQTWLILELCDGGTLLDLLDEGSIGAPSEGKSSMKSFRLAHVLTLLLDVARGMSYLHARNVLHGDLKPGNVLIKHVHGAPYGRVAKVSDFGLSRALNAGQSHRSTRTLATLNHAPPELLRLGRLSPAADVYSFGVLMWGCYTGLSPFAGMHYGEVFEAVALHQQRPEVPAGMPPAYAVLMQQSWSADPFQRPPFTAVEQQLESMLAGLVQDEADAQERHVADL